VKRLLLSIILALGFHAMILSADFSWLKLAPQPTLQPRSIAIVLSTVKRQNPGSEADFIRMKQFVPKESAVPDKIAEKQPEPGPSNKSGKNPDSIQNPTPIRHKQNLKALTLKKQTIKTTQTVHSADTAPDNVWIKKTNSMPNGPSEPPILKAAVPATETKHILSESPQINIARPLYKQNTSPKYPVRARRMGYEGLVMLKVLVGENGRVDDLEVLESSGYSILDKAAIASVKKWIFEPGTEDGKKKKMWVKIPIRFELE